MALFVRVGGGIYTKVVAGGADHINVLEANPRS
jgi:Na+/H+-translocating membrane pyrophosphatase